MNPALIPAIFISIIAAVLIYEYNVQNAPSSCCICGNTGCQGACMITNDPTTWPSGDRVWLICHAIALAEGANVEGSNPDRLNNPGDISDGFLTYGGEWHSGSSVTHFPDKATGWKWLHNKINNAINGSSLEYHATDTWLQFAQKWSGDSTDWVANVTSTLGVSPNSTIQDYMNS